MKILIICGLLLFLLACSSDDGNYDYTDPGTVDFFSMPTEGSGIIGEPLFIEGVFTTETAEADLEFLWYIERSGTDLSLPTVIDTISTERNLDIINALPAGNQDLHFNVYNRAFDVNYRHTIEMSIGSNFAVGWGLLKDMGDGTADYDFISTISNIHLQNNLLNLKGERLQGTPVILNYYLQQVGATGVNVWLSLYTDQTANVYDSNDLSVVRTGLDEFFTSSTGIDLPITGGIPRAEVFSRPDIGFIHIGGAMYSVGFDGRIDFFPTWSNTPVTIDDGYRVTFTGAWASSGQYYTVYDELHNRYGYVEGTRVTSLKELRTYSVETSSPFDPNDLGNKTCLWLGDNRSNSVMSLVKDDAQTYYFQKFSVTFGPAFTADYEVAVPSGFINDNSVLLAGRGLDFTYFSNGGTIGRFIDSEDPSSASFQADHITNYSSETVTVLYNPTMPGTEGQLAETLAIGLEGAGGSSLVLFDLGNNAEIARYAVEGRIVDIKHINSLF